jgi:hypothetical protein
MCPVNKYVDYTREALSSRAVNYSVPKDLTADFYRSNQTKFEDMIKLES